jgi:hypothetical protein
MTDATVPLHDDEPSDENPTAVGPMRVARIWKKRQPMSEGSLGTSLKALDILYDDGEPLTREELEARLIPRLDPYERSYITDWYRHSRDLKRQYVARRASEDGSAQPSSLKDTVVSIDRAIHGWITAVFLKRVSQGHTVIRTADGRLGAGPGKPRMARADGRTVAYTAATRHQLAQEDHEKHRLYLVDVELSELLKQLELPDEAARAQLLAYLVRRFLGNAENQETKSLDMRKIRPMFDHLDRIADTPAIRQALIQRLFTVLFPRPEGA